MAITNGYATLEQIRAELPEMQVSDTVEDTKLEMSIEAASRQIDAALGYRLYVDGTVQTREFHADSTVLVDLYEQDGNTPKAGISTASGLIIKTDDAGDGTFSTTWSASDYLLLPLNGGDETEVCWTEVRAVGNYRFPRPSNGRPGVQITARFGWSAVPDWATKACLIQALQLYKSKDAPFGVASFGDVGGGLRVRVGLNPLAAALVYPHARASVG